MHDIRKAYKSRREFNNSMKDYLAVIVQSENVPFDDDLFRRNGIILPSDRLKYTPPSEMGIKHSQDREEIIPGISSSGKYLICDDYCGEGGTFEMAMIRFLEKDVDFENIWCMTYFGNKEQREIRIKDYGILLDKGELWHNYFIRQGNKRWIEDAGFRFPVFPVVGKNL